MSTVGETWTARMGIHPDTTIGTVRLTVSDLARSRDFYERAIGLQAVDVGDGAVALGPQGGRALVELHGDSSAPPLDPRATGLYHYAFLVPSRRDLAFALARLAEARWPLDGASDHLVSEALYLSDPDGIGIEIYRDRPREEWRRTDGEVAMSTLPLSLDAVYGELAGATELQHQAPPLTKIGHVHLQVADLREAEDFYNGVLGFDVVVRSYPGALFVSAGGYHHHVGLNTWRSAGAAPPKPGSIGLRSFEVVLPDEQALERVLDRVRTAGIPLEQDGDGWLLRDPSDNGVNLRAA
jgi:catechol 2,3-dioxygenase